MSLSTSRRRERSRRVACAEADRAAIDRRDDRHSAPASAISAVLFSVPRHGGFGRTDRRDASALE